MSSKPAVLFEAQLIPAAETALPASPANILTLISKFSGCNTNALAITVTVKVVPSGGSAATGNTLVSAKPLLPGEDYGFPQIVGQNLGPGDFISVLPSDTGLVLRGSGIQSTV